MNTASVIKLPVMIRAYRDNQNGAPSISTSGTWYGRKTGGAAVA